MKRITLARELGELRPGERVRLYHATPQGPAVVSGRFRALHGGRVSIEVAADRQLGIEHIELDAITDYSLPGRRKRRHARAEAASGAVRPLLYLTAGALVGLAADHAWGDGEQVAVSVLLGAALGLAAMMSRRHHDVLRRMLEILRGGR